MKPRPSMLLAGVALAGLLSAAHAQMGTPPPAGPPAIRPPAPVRTVPPLSPQPVAPLEPVPAAPVQPSTGIAPVPPLQPGTPQLTIPLNNPPPPVPPAVPAPPTLPRSADEPHDQTLARCNALAGAAAQTECRRRAGVESMAR